MNAMKKYTGRNLFHRAMLVLSENPIELDRPGAIRPIEVMPGMGEFRLHLHCANMSYMVSGTLPVTDLPLIEAAIVRNGHLRAHYAIAKVRQGGRNRRWYDLTRQCDLQISESTAHLNQSAEGLIRTIRDTITAGYQPLFDEIEIERRADFRIAEPGMDEHGWDYRRLVASIEARAEAAAGISQEEEEKGFEVAPEWTAEWDAFMAASNFNVQQCMLVRAIRSQSANRILITEQVLRGPCLSRVADAFKVFDRDTLTRIAGFANKMAFKRAPFAALAGDLAPSDIQAEEADGELPAPAP